MTFSVLTLATVLSISIISKSWAVNCVWEDDEHTKLNITGDGGEEFTGCDDYSHLSAIEVTFGEGIYSIGSDTFADAFLLKSVNMPFVQMIGTRAFSGAGSLQRVTISDNLFVTAGALSSTHLTDVNCIGSASQCQLSIMDGGDIALGGLDIIDATIYSIERPTENCSGYSQGVCIACMSGYTLSNSQCVSNTPSIPVTPIEEDPIEETPQQQTAASCAADGKVLQGKECVSSCGTSFKLNDGECDRQRYTPAEAAAVLHNDNTNSVTITFKK